MIILPIGSRGAIYGLHVYSLEYFGEALSITNQLVKKLSELSAGKSSHKAIDAQK